MVAGGVTKVEPRKLCVVIPPCRARSDWLEAIALSATLEGWQVEGGLRLQNIADHIATTVSFVESFDAAISSGAAISDVVVLIGEPELDEHNPAFGDVAYVSRCFLCALHALNVVRHKLPTEPRPDSKDRAGIRGCSPRCCINDQREIQSLQSGDFIAY